MKASFYYERFEMQVGGRDMNCPMCKALIKDGTSHACSNPKPSQAPAKKAMKKK